MKWGYIVATQRRQIDFPQLLWPTFNSDLGACKKVYARCRGSRRSPAVTSAISQDNSPSIAPISSGHIIAGHCTYSTNILRLRKPYLRNFLIHAIRILPHLLPLRPQLRKMLALIQVKSQTENEDNVQSFVYPVCY